MSTLSSVPYFDAVSQKRISSFEKDMMLRGVKMYSVGWYRQLNEFKAGLRLQNFQAKRAYETAQTYTPISTPPLTNIDEPVTYTVSIHADMLKIKRNDAPAPTHGVFERGEVVGFSDRSRKRMIEALASITKTPDFFCTLTWSDDVATLDPELFRPQFEAFRRRLERAYPDIKAMWRIEIEDRKSGDRTGEDIIHMHLLIWMETSQEIKDAVIAGNGQQWRAWWHEITGSKHEWHFKRFGLQLEPIKSRRHAYHYCSKYVAKTTDDNHAIGRRWGRIGKLDTLPVFEIEVSKQEYIELKRIISAYAAKRKKWIGKKLKRSNVNKGITAFGLGAWNDTNHGLFNSTIFKLLVHVLGKDVVKNHILTDEFL